MDILLNDVKQIIYQYIHRSNMDNVCQQLQGWIEWSEVLQCTVFVWRRHQKAFGWRDLSSFGTSTLCPIYRLQLSIYGVNEWLDTRFLIPARYEYSIGR